MIVTADTADAVDMGLAKETLEVLEANYPNWQWTCGIAGGMVLIRSTVVNWILRQAGFKEAASICMALKYSDMGDATQRKKQVMRAGGQLLERANIARKSREIGNFEPIKGFDASLGGM